MFLKIIFSLVFVLIPTSAFAWGPMAHCYFGAEVLNMGSFLPVALYAVLKRHTQCYIYGNLMADAVLGKRFVPEERNSHNWSVALNLLDSSKKDSEMAFSLGYMSHLAADTVVHSKDELHKWNVKHALMELKADNRVSSDYWRMAVTIDSALQVRHDAFLNKYVDTAALSFNTNKRIYKSAVALSFLNHRLLGNIFDKFTDTGLSRRLDSLYTESLDRILDVLCNGSNSSVLKETAGVG